MKVHDPDAGMTVVQVPPGVTAKFAAALPSMVGAAMAMSAAVVFVRVMAVVLVADPKSWVSGAMVAVPAGATPAAAFAAMVTVGAVPAPPVAVSVAGVEPEAAALGAKATTNVHAPAAPTAIGAAWPRSAGSSSSSLSTSVGAELDVTVPVFVSVKAYVAVSPPATVP